MSHLLNPYSKGGDIDPIFGWEESQGMCGHVLKLPQESHRGKEYEAELWSFQHLEVEEEGRIRKVTEMKVSEVGRKPLGKYANMEAKRGFFFHKVRVAIVLNASEK